jgi:hypothetical protein
MFCDDMHRSDRVSRDQLPGAVAELSSGPPRAAQISRLNSDLTSQLERCRTEFVLFFFNETLEASVPRAIFGTASGGSNFADLSSGSPRAARISRLKGDLTSQLERCRAEFALF